MNEPILKINNLRGKPRMNSDVIFQPVRDAVAATRHFLLATQLIKVTVAKLRFRSYPGPSMLTMMFMLPMLVMLSMLSIMSMLSMMSMMSMLFTHIITDAPRHQRFGLGS